MLLPTFKSPAAFVLPALLLATSLPAAAADNSNLTASQILDKALAKGTVGFSQGTATLMMNITNAKGETKSRTLDIKAKREDGLVKSLVKFQRPAEVAGIAFLVIEKKDALPDQYVYVPAAKVVRRVAPGNASSSFFGSDFAFVDLMPLPASEADKVALKRLDDEEVGKQPTYVIEAVPQVEGSPYGKLVVYVHQKHLIPLKIDFFDDKMKPLKTLKVKKLKKIKGELVPVEMTMANSQQGSQTLVVISNPNPDAKLSDSDFTEEAMQR